MKIHLTKPILIMLYGYPAAGKSHFARQLSEELHVAHIHADRIRGELFKRPTFSERETIVVRRLMQYMSEQLLRAGIGVIYDDDISKAGKRRALREMARSCKAEHLLIWVQIDAETAFARSQGRDRRTIDDKYALAYTKTGFEKYLSELQNPLREDYVVISGKHTFNTQKSAVLQKLHEMRLVDVFSATNKEVKPELVNRVPHFDSGRVDATRRNIAIR